MHAISLAEAAGLDVDHVLTALATSRGGLAAAGLEERRRTFGSVPVSSEAPSAWTILLRQLNNPLLILMVVTCGLSLGFGQKSDAAIILAIVAFSLGLGFFDEYRSERAVADLKTRIRRHGDRPARRRLGRARGRGSRPGRHRAHRRRRRRSGRRALDRSARSRVRRSDPHRRIGARQRRPIAPVPGAAAAAVAPASCALMGTNVRTRRGARRRRRDGQSDGVRRDRRQPRRAPEPETAFQAGLRVFSRCSCTSRPF